MTNPVSPAPPGTVFVRGYFDPLLAVHARLLAHHKGSADKLVVLLADPAEPLIPLAARANLIAGLSSVDAVVIPAGGVDTAPCGATVIDECAADLVRRDELIAEVSGRHARPRE